MAVVASSAAAMLRFNCSSLVRLHLCLIASVILLIAQQSSAKTVNVGGALGWTDFDTAISAAPNYEKWSSTNSINVGDVLVFSFPAGFQNVYLMPAKSAHDSCDFSEATELDAGNAGTYAWRATKEGTYYFSSNKLVEGLGTHCKAGQKLAITVTTTTTISKSTKELKPESYFGQRFTRSMIESLATAPAVAPVSPPAPVPVGAPVPVVAPPVVAPVAAPVLTPTPTPSTSLPLVSPPAPPTGPAPAPASPPGHNAGAKVSTPAGAGIFTATLALVALCL
ncbi:hypothetical protein CY35_09G103100 [Sphagnum magellanicum]|jgi:uncharacterized cupredoxin-like copper-binding protein|nr:hypothetical protein CY35_09G103100 [Sphagnum magellanicum]KAH9553128.1 hypothetical protein CY35_09G103100 [Sphagnum magellanicum]KAH9553129.1 hypothetical protein CY35_09G103100 [Sphagnum magellanicum]